MKAVISISDEMEKAMLECKDGNNCTKCPCQLGTGDCLSYYLDRDSGKEMHQKKLKSLN